MTQYYDPRTLGLDVKDVNGAEAIVMCPFHDDHHPSATFNMTNGLFHCFACSEGMNAMQIARSLGTRIGRMSHPLSLIGREEADAREWRQILSAPLALTNRYLQSRGITEESVRTYGIRELQNGVAFINCMQDGTAIGAQIRHYDGETRYTFIGRRTPVWPVQVLTEHKQRVVIVEGVFGALKGLQAGIPTVAVMGASAIYAANRMLNGRQTITMFDDDFAGYLGMAKFMYLRGSRAHVPGCEADEMNPEQWNDTLSDQKQWTSSIAVLRDRSGDGIRFDHLIHRLISPAGKRV